MRQEPITFHAKNGQTFTIRPPREDEAQISLDMMVEVAAESPYILSTPESFKQRSVENQIKWFKECAESEIAILLALYHQDRMIGFCNGSGYKDIKRKHRAGLGVSMRQEFRGLGLGYKMMEALISSMKRFKGVQIIELDVMLNNRPALKMYEKLGFKRAGVFPNAYILPTGEISDNLTMYMEV
jgi:RimJ/RimL family protein N-acetyltransferase